ncbi:MAG TPA: hypothetical protein VGN34_07385, partial [Ktedonobacteraceae bacterium]
NESGELRLPKKPRGLSPRSSSLYFVAHSPYVYLPMDELEQPNYTTILSAMVVWGRQERVLR